MSKKFSIAVDAMGGDNAPEKVLEGINLLFEKKIDVHMDIYGDKDLILKSINKYKYLNNNNLKTFRTNDIYTPKLIWMTLKKYNIRLLRKNDNILQIRESLYVKPHNKL